jgi:hypothetical protein
MTGVGRSGAINRSEVADGGVTSAFGAFVALGVFAAGFSTTVSAFGLRARVGFFSAGVTPAVTSTVFSGSAFFLAILFLRAAIIWATLTRAIAQNSTINLLVNQTSLLEFCLGCLLGSYAVIGFPEKSSANRVWCDL